MSTTLTAEEMREALAEDRVVIKIGRDNWVAKAAGTKRVLDLGDGHWMVRVTGGPSPRKNGHGIISNFADDIPFAILPK
jgi:hypothetical protein